MKGMWAQQTHTKDSVIRTLFVGLLIYPLLFVANVDAGEFDFGSVSGEFSVDGGAATYTIPISVPAGVGGMQPDLALGYSSHGGVGWLGFGWTLQGLTSIHRCAATEAQDGSKGSIHFDENDRYCMSGQRLMVVNGGVYGAADTEYRTEIDSFSRFTAVGGDATIGPDSWLIETKSGQTIELGVTEDSLLETPQVAPSNVLKGGGIRVSWHVNKITDAVGNEIRFLYDNDPDLGVIRPMKVEYGNNKRVEFEYGPVRPRGDRITGYTAGVKTTINQFLNKITTYTGGALVRVYKLFYEQAPTTWRLRISEMEECSYYGPCLPRTKFGYADWDESDVLHTETAILAANQFTNANNWRVEHHPRMLSDVDGDGVSDIVGFSHSGVEVKLSSSGGTITLDAFGRTHGWEVDRHPRMMVDIDADGRADVVGFHDDGVYYSLSQGDSFSEPVHWITDNFGYDNGVWRVDEHPRMLADLDGDTKADVIGFGESQVHVRLASGEDFDDDLPDFVTDTGWNITRNPRYVADINGDGRADIVGFSNIGVIVAYSEGDRFTTPVNLLNAFVQNQERDRWLMRELADVNGDGTLDIVGFGRDGVYVSLSTGVGFLTPERWINKWGSETTESYATYTDPANTGWNLKKHTLALADFNGDGRVDIIGFADDGVYASASLGDRFSNVYKLHTEFGSANTRFPQLTPDKYDVDNHLRMFSDINGDGLADIIGFHEDNVVVAYNHLTNAGDITRITTGNGVDIDIDYKGIAGTNDHYEKGTDANQADGELDIQIPIRVVTSVATSNGIGGVNRQSYRYGSMALNTKGRGPLGYKWIEVLNHQTDIRTRTEFEQTFPYTGTVVKSQVFDPDGMVLNEASNILYPVLHRQPGTVYRPNILRTESKEYELGETDAYKTVIQENLQYDNHGNLLESLTTVTGGGESFKTHTVNEYEADDEMAWHLGRLTRSVVTRSQFQGAIQTHSEYRTSEFEYDPVKGLMTKEVVEPGDPILELVTEYSYDRFGNKNTTTTTGLGLTEPRFSKTQFVGSGRFPYYSENALGHRETYQYHNICGKDTFLTGPNNLSTRWSFDAFCRETREGRADGTITTTDRYRVIDSTQPIQDQPWGFVRNERYPLANVYYKYVTTETGKPTITVYYDQLGRELRSETVGMNNKIIYQDTEYNALGQVRRSSRPYFKDDPIHWVNFSYDILGRTTLVDAPADRGARALVKTIYNGLKTTVVDAKNRATTTTKDALDRVVRTDQPEGAVVINRYDAYDNLIETEDADGNLVTMTYDKRGRKKSMTDPNMGHWVYHYNALGELIRQVDARSQIVDMEYDVLGRMVRRSESEGVTVWTYDTSQYGRGKLASVSGPDGYSKTYSYDNLTRLLSTTTTISGRSYRVVNAYDPSTGRLKSVTRPGNFKVENVYDENGYLIAKRSPHNLIVGYDKGHLRRLRTAAINSAQDAVARAEHYAAEASDIESWAQTFQTVVAEQAASQTLAQSAEGLQYHTAYKRYTHSVTNEVYLETPDKIVILRRKTNTPIVIPPETHYKMVSDANGGQSLQAIDAETWNLSIRGLLNPTGEFVYFGDYNADGQDDYLLRDEDVDPLYSSEQLQRLGEAGSEIRAVADILWDRAVDALTAATQMIAVAGQVDDRLRQTELWAENLDGDDLVKMSSNDGYVIYWQANSRDAEQRLTGFRQGNGVVTTRDYDTASGNLLSIQSGFNFGTNIRELEYHYDLAGNVVSRHDRIQEINEDFSYDNLDRLTKNTLHGALKGYKYSYSTSYDYDRSGNLIYKSDVGHYTYGSANRNRGNAGPTALISAGTNHRDYSYDLNGNLLSGGGRSFDWTSFNKPRRLARGEEWTEFSYGPDRARYQKRTSSGETTTYVGKLYEEIRQGGTTTFKHFIHTEDGVAAIYVRKIENGRLSREMRYLLTDALGSVDTITDSVGVIVDRMSFDPYGMRRPGSWRHDMTFDIPALTNRGFTGHEHVDSIGIIHMNGRIYDPELGRFLSADPNIQSPLNSQSHNRYSYVLNNPLRYTDPSGYFFSSLRKFMKRYGRTIIAIGVTYVAGVFGAGAYGILSVAAAGSVGGFVAGYITTGTKQGAYKGAVIGAFSAVFANAIGTAVTDGSMARAFGEYADAAAKTLHGISQGTISAAAGGDFKSGFLGAFTGSIGGRLASGNLFAGTIIASMVGGIAAKLGGGKFANGAVSGAFVYMFGSAGRSGGSGGGEWIYPNGGSTNLNDYDAVMTNGILGDRATFVLAVNQTQIPGYFNPSHGFVLDVLESIGQKFFGWAGDPLAAGFANGLAGVNHPMTINAHSQGTLTAANAALYYGLPAGSSFVFRSPAITYFGASAAAQAVGGSFQYVQPWGDGANLWAPSFNPLRFGSGMGDLFCGFCTHSANGLP